ncbi:outer membrane protein assembly factor BamD [Robiginitomaculum antarcticum]|uniref:outer membrane protein assembly factor BamD n=1 Tax=Robiginitomaculum antarcticum TaxID=437507 RepID=UPI0003762512|nr:outer membrane protein assembly factor BamD [Robiginitomaculum antarcticum]
MNLSKSVFRSVLAAVLVGITVSGCASFREERAAKLNYVERPAETLYNAAFEKLDQRNWTDAVLLFDEVERQHPYSEWARRSMLMSAYAKYRSADYEESIAASERFISLHPGNNSAPYAYYLIGINYYDQIYDVGRDQGTTVSAENALRQVIRRYPESEYAADARLKLELTHDHLAGKEMSIGRYYLREGQSLAAIGRFQNVVKQYETTSHTEEALHRLVEAYVSIGLIEEAKQVGSVLGYNYPQSRWYQDSYKLLARYDVDLDSEIKKPRENGYWRRLRNRLF